MAPQGIDETLNIMMKCVDDALTEDGFGTLIVANTIGDPAIIPGTECGQDELWGHFLRAFRGDRDTGAEMRNRKPCAPATWWAQYRITLARCFPMLDDQGNLADPQDRSAAARTLHDDAATIQTALNCCDAIEEPPFVEQIAVTVNPSGGVSLLVATVRARVSMGRARNPRPGVE